MTTKRLTSTGLTTGEGQGAKTAQRTKPNTKQNKGIEQQQALLQLTAMRLLYMATRMVEDAEMQGTGM